MLLCKICQNSFSSPCSFYSHTCNDERTGKPTVYWCVFCEVSQMCEDIRANVMKGNMVGPLAPSVAADVAEDHGNENTIGNSPTKESSGWKIESCMSMVPVVQNQPKTRPYQQNDLKAKSEMQAFLREDTDLIKYKPSLERGKSRKSGIASSIMKVSDGEEWMTRDKKSKMMTTRQVVVARRPEVVKEKKKEVEAPPSYVCSDCTPHYRILPDPTSLTEHHRETGGKHVNIRPMWVYNKMSLKLKDVSRSGVHGAKVEKELDIVRGKRKAQEQEASFKI
jgi:hypothetical protein